MSLRLTEADLANLLRRPAAAAATTKGTTKAKVLQAELRRQIELVGLGPVIPEHRFHPTRRWRIDLFLPESALAIEIEGGIFLKKGGGRHNRGSGMREDMHKYAEIAIAGWRLIRVLPEWVKNGVALDYVRRAAAAKET